MYDNILTRSGINAMLDFLLYIALPVAPVIINPLHLNADKLAVNTCDQVRASGRRFTLDILADLFRVVCRRIDDNTILADPIKILFDLLLYDSFFILCA